MEPAVVSSYVVIGFFIKPYPRRLSLKALHLGWEGARFSSHQRLCFTAQRHRNRLIVVKGAFDEYSAGAGKPLRYREICASERLTQGQRFAW